MEIHFRAVVRKRLLNCWFNTWDLSQVVHSFETILATVFNKHSTTDVKSLEKVHPTVVVVMAIDANRSTASCVTVLVQCLQLLCVVS